MITTERSWDLDALLPGGVHGRAFADEVAACRGRLERLIVATDAPPVAHDRGPWPAVIVETFDLWEQVQLVVHLASCATMARTDDEAARLAAQDTSALLAALNRILGRIGRALRGASDADLDALAAELPGYGPWLHDLRARQVLDLPPEQQDLLDEADRELLHGWAALYAQVVGPLVGTLGGESLGVGQLAALNAHPDATIRRDAHQALVDAHAPALELCATALNHLVGTRQMRNDRAGIGPLDWSLADNRVDFEVLEAMWAGIDQIRPALVEYLRAKAALLGRERLDWWDLPAPVGTPPQEALLGWDEVQALILDAFEAAEPALARSARRLLAEGAVESADRPHKRVGAACFPFCARKTTRLFCTFTGTLDSAAMLAHELGHGWHADVLYTAPMVRRLITPATAETASMYAESLVRERASSPDDPPDRRRYDLDQQLQLGVMLLSNIDARHRFELAAYALRRRGALSAPALNDAMTQAQRAAYGDALETWEPTFWARKPHFFSQRTAFLNWPYAFGYLFGQVLRRRPDVDRHDLLLRTGWQDTRGLARDALGADLADPAFWADAGQPLVDAARRFVTLADA